MKKTETTLLFLRKEGQILLAMKKRGFGEGKYNGIGGKLEAGETPEQAMSRETEEEIVAVPTKYEKVAAINFYEFVKGNYENVHMSVYVATKWRGEPTETDEMRPEWFNEDEIPYDKMFPDDKYWLPLVLDGKKIAAEFHFDEDWNMKDYKIKEEK
jgi:mutator protein MutT